MQAEGAGQEEKQEQIMNIYTERNDQRMEIKTNFILIEKIFKRNGGYNI